MKTEYINKVTLQGRLGRDAETRNMPSGVTLTRFSVATERSWSDNKTGEPKTETNWSSCVLWRGAESVLGSLTKGATIYVEGRIQSRKWQDSAGVVRYTTEIVCDNVLPVGGGNGDRAISHPQNSHPTVDDDDSGVPF